MEVHEIFIDEDDPILYRDHNDYYCEIVPKPSVHLCFPGWYVLSNRIINNNKFIIHN